MHEILAAGVQFLHALGKNSQKSALYSITIYNDYRADFLRISALVTHKLGRDHVDLWNVVGRIDPNMRKVYSQHESQLYFAI